MGNQTINFSMHCLVKVTLLSQQFSLRAYNLGPWPPWHDVTELVKQSCIPFCMSHTTRAGVEISSGTKIMSESGKNIGKLVTRLGGLGLALLRVKEMYVVR